MEPYQEVLDKLLAQTKDKNVSQWQEMMKSLSSSSLPGTATQFQPFNLDPVGKLLLPEFTPFQNEGCYAVEQESGGDSVEYRAIVAKNANKSTGAAVAATSVTGAASTNGRAKLIDYSYLTKKKTFAKYAPEGAVTWELYRSSGPFNALGKATIASLITAKELEERHVLFCCSTALGTPATPAGTPSNTGGTLTNAASPYNIKVIALNYYGWWYWLADGIAAADQTPITAQGMAAGAVQGESIASAASANVTIAAGTTGSIAATVTAIKGAFAYIWLLATAGTYKLSTITTAPFATLTTYGSLTVAAPTADGSAYDTDGYPCVWDGLYAQTVLDADIPGEYLSLAGNASPGVFGTTGAGSGITEVETILRRMWSKWKSAPEYAVMSAGTLAVLSAAAISSGAPAYRLTVDSVKNDGNIFIGTILAGIRNQYAQSVVKPIIEQVMPDGKILFYSKTIDYKDANVATNLVLHTSDHWMQDFFARTHDVAPPGPWSTKTYGAPTLYWPRGCSSLEDIAVTP